MIVPEGKIAIGKLAQALMHGARVVALQGNFDQALEIVRELADRHPIELVNSVNPYRIDGQPAAGLLLRNQLYDWKDHYVTGFTATYNQTEQITHRLTTGFDYNVLTGQDLPDRRVGRLLRDIPVLARDRVLFIGEKVAAVAAETPEAECR